MTISDKMQAYWLGPQSRSFANPAEELAHEYQESTNCTKR